MELWLLQSLEMWKRYKDFDYLVSQSGKVLSCKRNIILSPALQGKGYLELQSATEAAKILGFGRSSINSCVLGRYKQYNGFIWRR